MPKKIVPFFLPLLGLLLIIHSPARGESWGIWPFFSYYADEAQREMEILGPLFTWREGRDGEEWGVRPLLYYTGHPSQELQRWEFLYPLGKYQQREGDHKFYLIPFSLFRDEVTSTSPERREENSSIVTAFWGQTDEGERYGGVFPFAGRLKDRFGRDEITFYLWPLYSRIEDDGEITERIVWPFFSLTRGEAEGLYIWPLWGRRERVGEYARGFVLWPLYTYMDEDLGTDDPVSKRYYLPLYVSVRSQSGGTDMFLPPFFFHQKGYDPPFEKWEIPWPFLTLVRGGGVRETTVLPLFRVRDEERKRRRFFLWPLYKYEWDLMGNEQEEVYRLALINKYRAVREIETERKAIDANLWPLFDYRRGLDGGVDLYIFPLLPLHDEGMTRNIYPLFWVYRHHRSPTGQTLSDFLWGLYRRRTSPHGSSTQLAFLLRIEKKGSGDLYLSLLEGLFRYQRIEERGKVGVLFADF